MSRKTNAVPVPRLTDKQTAEIENLLRPHFPNTEAYRYNPASIRVRIIDDLFLGKTDVEREKMVDRVLNQLPDSILSDIMLLLTLTRKEAADRRGRYALINFEFENPSPSRL